MRNRKVLALVLGAMLSPGAFAQTLTGLKVEPASAQVGESVKVTIDFAVDGGINCGVRLHFGDGKFEDYKINQKKDVPLVVARAYANAGEARLMAEPKTLGLLGRCTGRNQTAVLTVVAPASAAPVAARPPAAPAAGGGQAGAADPLSVYTLCATAAYAELIGKFPNPTEAMARARLACETTRTALEEDVRRRAGAATPQVMLGIDAEILKTLRAASR